MSSIPLQNDVTGQATLFESIVVNVNDVVLVTEAEPIDSAAGGPRVVYVNPAFTRMTGYAPEEIIGLTPRLLQSPKTDQGELDRLRAALERWQPVEVELLNVHKDGSEFWAQINIVPVADAQGRYRYWVSIQRDITVRKHAQIALEALLDNSSDLVLALDQDGAVVSVSPTVSRVLGREPGELLGEGLRQHLHPQDRVALQTLTQPQYGLRLGHSGSAELRVQHADGSWRWLQVSAVEPSASAVAAVVLSCADVTARKLGEQALRRADDRFRSAFSDAPIGMAVTEPLGRHVQVNEAYCQLLGRTSEELLGMTMAEVMHPVDLQPSLAQRMELLEGSISRHRYETRFVRADGTVVGVLHSSSVVPARDGQPQYLIDHVEDITERKVFEDELRYQASHDGLTGLPNRVLLSDRLERALRMTDRRIGSLAVLFLDLDRFKVINDSLGHAVGDAVLIEVARRLASVLRAGDTAARFGGDEFVVLCEDTSAEQARSVADRIVSVVSAPILVGDTSLVLTASVGVALTSLDSTDDAETMLRDADAAMYSAKDGGKARFAVFDRALGVRAAARMQMETDLRHGIVAGQLRLHYQPEVRLADRVLVGMEALVRWEHPSRGLLLPGEFVPLAEEVGLIRALGDWVLVEAVAHAGRWAEAGRAASTVWINLSVHQLGDASFVRRVADLLTETRLNPAMLGFEITESALMSEEDGSRHILQGLRDIGVCLALDDFGTGYSSLAYLAQFPFDTVKIDQSFVSGLDQAQTRRESYAIVSAVVGLSHALRLRVVGEGVETDSQAQALHGLGCEIGQGYLLGKPMPERGDRDTEP